MSPDILHFSNASPEAGRSVEPGAGAEKCCSTATRVLRVSARDGARDPGYRQSPALSKTRHRWTLEPGENPPPSSDRPGQNGFLSGFQVDSGAGPLGGRTTPTTGIIPWRGSVSVSLGPLCRLKNLHSFVRTTFLINTGHKSERGAEAGTFIDLAIKVLALIQSGSDAERSFT